MKLKKPAGVKISPKIDAKFGVKNLHFLPIFVKMPFFHENLTVFLNFIKL